MRKGACALLLAVAFAAFAGLQSVARADGDPGSDVLVSQNLFAGADAGLSLTQQEQLGGLLQTASADRFPVRVAIIGGPSDLGSVTALWLKPSAYAQFLGIELSLAYKQLLLVVMPNGFGVNWPGHSAAAAYKLLSQIGVGHGANALASATQTAVERLAGAAGVKLTGGAGTSSAASSGSQAASSSATGASGGGRHSDELAAWIGAALVVLFAGGFAVVRLRRRPGFRDAMARPFARFRRGPDSRRPRWVVPSVAVLGAIVVAEILVVTLGGSASSSANALASNPNIDPGTPLSKPAPGFTLTDQFGVPVSLSSFRGKVVVLAFNDAECTTICPLTTTAIEDAKAMLGSSASHVQLLGVDANPAATALEDVWSYSDLHGLLHRWLFTTGSLTQLRRVWKQYGIEAEIQHGLISHTPALFVIDPQGRLRKLYITQQSYAAVGQFAQVLAQEVSSLLPGHPPVDSKYSYSEIAGTPPTKDTSVPRVGGGAVAVGPGAPRLTVFFATWDQEVTPLAGQLDALDRYRQLSASERLPAVSAIDEGTVEPSASTVTQFLHQLPHPLTYPVGIDRSGRLADGYEVEGLPWFVLTSSTGQILWWWEVDTQGWLSPTALAAHVRAALEHAPKAPTTAAGVARALAGSPPRLAALHQQASRLLGSESALAARVRSLRGYPIVVNAWASWCTPCQAEFGLFANASAHYGRQVAFVGADTDDTFSNAESFLQQHSVSYPSYEVTESQLDFLLPGGVESLPTTIYINPAGKVVYIHDGQYDSQGTLDQDIESYALGG